MHPISIIIYPLFGGWRAECKTCGAYGISGNEKYLSAPAQAIKNLSEEPHNAKGNTCQHHYGQYKPRVICQIDYKHLRFIDKTRFTTQGCETFPAILLDNKYNVTVINASGLTPDWSSYSYVRHCQLEEQKNRKAMLQDACLEAKQKIEREAGEKAMRMALEHTHQTLHEMALECNSKLPTETFGIWNSPFKYILYLIVVVCVGYNILFEAAILGVKPAKQLIEKIEVGYDSSLYP